MKKKKSQFFSYGNIQNRNIKKSGFTLAEILITIAIIGIIAALTIAPIVHNYKNQEYVAKLKKTYSELSHALVMAESDYGSPNTWVIGPHGTTTSAKKYINTYLKPYLKVKEMCDEKLGNCNYTIYSLKGTETPHGMQNGGSRAGFILDDGTIITIFYRDSDGKYADILVDVNGKKEPNTFGKDVFSLHEYFESNVQLTFYGYNTPSLNISSGNGVGCNKNESGQTCGKFIHLLGWHIPNQKEYSKIKSGNYPYPW